jgi:exosome complex component RRP40
MLWQYVPAAGDLVIGTVQRSAGDVYAVALSPHAPAATLPHLAFEGATRKTRPQLGAGALVYARVSAAPARRPDGVELECAAGLGGSTSSAAASGGGGAAVAGGSGKAEGLGPLKGGALARVGGAGARWIAAGKRGGCVVLEELGRRIGFEVAVGRNGLVWVGTPSGRAGEAEDGGEAATAEVLAVVRVLSEVGGRVGMSDREQREVVERVLKGLGM